MTTDTDAANNYASFDDYVATSFDTGEQVALSSVWKRRSVVVDFGSFT